MLSILIGGGHDNGGDYGVVGDTPEEGQGATLLLDYNAVEGTGAVLPHSTMRRRIYSAADEDLVAVWPSAPRRWCDSRQTF